MFDAFPVRVRPHGHPRPRFEDLDEHEIVESGSIRADRRARLAGSEIVGHRTWESFALAVGPPAVRCATCRGYADAPDHMRGCPKFEPIPNAEARAGLREAYRLGKIDFRETMRASRQQRERRVAAGA